MRGMVEVPAAPEEEVAANCIVGGAEALIIVTVEVACAPMIVFAVVVVIVSVKILVGPYTPLTIGLNVTEDVVAPGEITTVVEERV